MFCNIYPYQIKFLMQTNNLTPSQYVFFQKYCKRDEQETMLSLLSGLATLQPRRSLSNKRSAVRELLIGE